MGFETKAGLLIGTGFIVCFAVVLSHRAPGDQVNAGMAYQVLARHGLQPPTRTTITTANEFARLPFQGASLVPMNFDDPAAADRRAGDPRRSPSQLIEPGARIEPGRRETSPPTDPNDGSVAALPWEALFGLSQDDGDHESREGAPAPDPTASATHEPAPTTAAIQDRRVSQPPGTYRVVPDDTLWRIARKAYGQADRRIVDAVYQANRDRMTAPNDLKPGMDLALPVIDGLNPTPLTNANLDARPGEPARKKAPPRAEKAGSPSEMRTYSVQRGDRYATIAERFLGDKSRWREIYDLNRDIFPDPGKIQYGVRIRLPVAD